MPETRLPQPQIDYDPAALPGQRAVLGGETPLTLDSGATLGPFHMAYETYGTLNADHSNAILVCHALTGDQYAASQHPVTGKPGWWDRMIGPGKPLDTDRFFVICANVIGGCMGSSGPRDIDPQTGEAYGLNFPVITIGDMVRAQAMLLDHLGIDTLFCVIGGSMGAMQALQWAVAYPDRVFACIPIAGAARHSAQNIAFHEVGRQAIMADPNWDGGAYAKSGLKPVRGLSVARMAAHITYLSEAALHRKFGRNLQDRLAPTFGFEADFQVESYLRHQGSTFVDRFDANSYLYITRAMDYFDIAAERGSLIEAFRDTPVRFALISFSSDWLFPTAESRSIVHALNAAGAQVSFVEIVTDRGHDAFLLDEPQLHDTIAGFLDGCATMRGLADRDRPAKPAAPAIRQDLEQIAALVEPRARLLDIGCGDGELLAYLVAQKDVDGRGLELSPEGVQASVARGLAVVQGDANTDLADYGDGSFDYVVLSRTLQAMFEPKEVIEALVRIGRRAIVSITNFGHWRVRWDLFAGGRMPMVGLLTAPWWNTPNIHHCTIKDFVELCDMLGVDILQSRVIDAQGRITVSRRPPKRANFFAEQGVFLLGRKDSGTKASPDQAGPG